MRTVQQPWTPRHYSPRGIGHFYPESKPEMKKLLPVKVFYSNNHQPAAGLRVLYLSVIMTSSHQERLVSARKKGLKALTNHQVEGREGICSPQDDHEK